MSRYAKNKMSNWVAEIAVRRNARAIFITLLVALFMVITGALPALAADMKIYPGSMGVRYAGTSTPTYYYSAIGNPSATQWLYLDMPVIRDLNGGISLSKVRVIDQNCRSGIMCQLCSVYRSGCKFYGRFTPRKWSKGCSCREQVVYPGKVKASKNSHYYFSCRIPAKYKNKTSYINSYYVKEY